MSRWLNIEIFRRMTAVGSAMFSKYLFITNVGLSFSLSGVGDMIEQKYEIVKNEKFKWDSRRTQHMAVSGMAIGIVCHVWYRYLDRALPGHTLKIIAKKVLLDQFICSPLCVAIFLLMRGLLEKSSSEHIAEEVINKALRLYAAELVIWPPAQFINFYFLPSRFRVLYDNTISLGYDVYASYVLHDNGQDALRH